LSIAATGRPPENDGRVILSEAKDLSHPVFSGARSHRKILRCAQNDFFRGLLECNPLPPRTLRLCGEDFVNHPSEPLAGIRSAS